MESAYREINTGSVGVDDATDPFTDGFEMELNSHATSAPVGSNRNAGINCDNATSRYRKVGQVGNILYLHRQFSLTDFKLCKFESPTSKLTRSAVQIISIRHRPTHRQARGPPINVILI